MLIIEVFADNQEDQTASTRASQNREAASAKHRSIQTNWLERFKGTIKALLAVTKDNNYKNNGF